MSPPRGRPVSVASDRPEEEVKKEEEEKKEEVEERGASAPVEEPAVSPPPAGREVAAHLRAAVVRDLLWDLFYG